jgi:hypothetical protein
MWREAGTAALDEPKNDAAARAQADYSIDARLLTSPGSWLVEQQPADECKRKQTIVLS